jgi:hypothetical protein
VIGIARRVQRGERPQQRSARRQGG